MSETNDKQKLDRLKEFALGCGLDLSCAVDVRQAEAMLSSMNVETSSGRRSAVSVPRTIDEESRTVEAVIATETPVLRVNWHTYELYGEVLPVEACRLSDIRGGEIPLLNGHQSYGDVLNQLGTTTDIRVEGNEIVGVRHFSRASHVDDIWTMVKEGHLKRQSIGYAINAKACVKKGKKAVVNGREWEAPSNMDLVVATDWCLLEDSVVIFPADVNTGNRSAVTDTIGNPEPPTQKENTMPSNTTTPENCAPAQESRAAVDAEIIELCGRNGMAERAAEFVRSEAGLDEVRKAVLETLEQRNARTPVAANVSITDDARDKNVRAMTAVLQERAGVQSSSDTALDEFRGMTMRDVAQRCVTLAGGRNIYDGSALFRGAMATGDFPKILSNTINRSLMQGFNETEETYTAWCDMSGRVNDFREQSVARGVAKFSLEEVREGEEYGYATMGEDGDKVKVAKYGKKIAYTWESMVNDDLAQLAIIPYEFARSARRLEGDIAYDFLIANPTLRDGKSLFHTDHGNLAGSGAAPSEGTFDAACVAMATQTDNGKNIYLQPRFVIGGHSIEMAVNKVLFSANYNDSNAAATQVNTMRGRLAGIYDARIDAYAKTLGTNPWFIAGSPRDTVRFFHLAGHESVFIDQWDDRDRDAYVVKARHVVGANCSYWQALYKNPGAAR